jgi:DMSO/TMAO reductase YedYZ molybdopterin-dependent catalytic subunit
MDPTNDVLLAMEMNDLPLPPDHGYPVRLMIPGYVGGRYVKWLRRIWISDHENQSYYHIWDNRVLPPGAGLELQRVEVSLDEGRRGCLLRGSSRSTRSDTGTSSGRGCLECGD